LSWSGLKIFLCILSKMCFVYQGDQQVNATFMRRISFVLSCLIFFLIIPY
jgi:hypothetical protein